MSRVAVAPIAEADLGRVGTYLHGHLGSRLSALEWAESARTPWSADAPNHGFMLLAADEIVGVYLAFYSSRMIEGRIERFCNLGAWCVSPKYRLYSLQLLKALLNQPGYHFTDLSPSGNTLSVNERLNFVRLDTSTALIPNLPLRLRSRKYRFVAHPGEVERLLSSTDLQIYRDHREARAARHAVLVSENQTCYVIFRRDRRKRLPLFASVLYVSNPPLFQRMTGFFGYNLLMRYGIPFTLAELRVIGGRPRGSIMLRSPRPKMYKSAHLQANQIDYLYSELVCVAW